MTLAKLRVVDCGWGERLPLGTLAEAGGRLLFEFSPEAISRGIEASPLRAPVPRPGAQPVAVTGPAHSYGLPGFIADALPDGWGLLLMDRALRRRGQDPRTVSVLDRLAMVGDRAPGALAFEPADDADAEGWPALTLEQLALDTAAVLADEGLHSPEQQLQRLFRLGGSAQGARPKALLRWHQRQWRADGPGAEGEPILVKFPAPGEHAETCAIEQAYAELGRLGGIAMPPTAYLALPRPHAAFGTRRFDRVGTSAGEHRVPLLSLAGLLDADFRLPSLDYATLMLATQRITGDYREVVKAFERCVFNVMAHNRDDHAKNFAFTRDAAGQWRLSPAFDLTFSFGPGGEHTTSIAGEGRAPGNADLMRAAEQGGLKRADARRVIAHWREVFQALPGLLSDVPVRASTRRQLLAQLPSISTE
ncbi:type II toxin-antitoxin system HipA family toxin [Roseateles sp. LYH14W]|uniref:Type II toxin-antitoxin system HipA family toxin n=1 Tax=Pelomonas parva TaxID=3299032 RepID=A0ABW7F4S3_9BURK